MGWDFYIATGSLLVVGIIGITVARANLKDHQRIQRNVEARRIYKKAKNERLRRFYGL